ncbi:MAG: endonuclease III domain-containing protein [Desulfovibrio sp.]|jgi:endonuclease-3 related protein|nr:endonuclease III domain-containing protein [Desulfovibrio sp.]
MGKGSYQQNRLMSLFSAMLAHFGPLRWWPGDSPFEIAVGAVLTQNTAWRNVEKAIAGLREKKALRPDILYSMSPAELEELLRPSGFFRLKTRRLRALLEYLRSYPGWDASPGNADLNFLRGADLSVLREELLAVRGIGPETADSILLYALDLPTFVVDAYTMRIFSRHGIFPPDIPYDEAREYFMDRLPQDVALYNEFHALIVRTGNTFCKKSRPLCANCPLAEFLDHEVD